MPDIQQNIRDWLRQRPAWLQEGAEILLSLPPGEEVSNEDIRKLSDMLKMPEKQKAAAHRAFDRFAPTSSPSGEIRLLEIGGISGIENLAPRKPLCFGTGNLCIIYGNNGSGKSGYTRLLKKACGNSCAQDLRHNVFKSPPSVSKCTIRYQISGEERQIEWRTDEEPIADIRAVDIFDADVAMKYLSKETEAAYTPPFVTFFEDLVKVCDRIKLQLQTERDQLSNNLLSLPSAYAGTEAGGAYNALRHDRNKISIQKFTQWRAEDKEELEQLTERLKATDPAALAREKRNTKHQVDRITGILQDTATAFSDKEISGIRALRANFKKSRRVAAEAATQIASAKKESAKLDIGTDTWKRLWEAARSYSQTAKRDFPVAADRICVLCHQTLDEDAQQRLINFEKFVLSELEGEAQTAEKAYQQALGKLPTPMTDDEILTQCQAAKLTEEHWPGVIGEFCEQARKAREVLVGESTVQAMPVVPPKSILDNLSERSALLEREAAQYDQDAKNFDRAKANKDKLNLEARHWTSQQADSIRAELERLDKVGDYEKCIKEANSRDISVMAGKIAESVITEPFVERFTRELKRFGASRIEVELSKKHKYGKKGQVPHEIRLKTENAEIQVSPDAILSEGERRIVGLAAFLADVTAQTHATPFVFDDPISSLDYDFEQRVAKRLAELAQNRQVIIFTHRLSLYEAVKEAAEKIEVGEKPLQPLQLCIEWFDGAAGHPSEQLVWNAKNTKQANHKLLEMLNNAKGKGDDSYRITAQGICSEFRKLLERTVEDDLLGKVVKRHRRSVTTDNRLRALSRIKRQDCEFIDGLMDKYSDHAHSQPLESPVPPPEEAELREDIKALMQWREEFKNRPAGD